MPTASFIGNYLKIIRNLADISHFITRMEIISRNAVENEKEIGQRIKCLSMRIADFSTDYRDLQCIA
jgi:hypothetical protein